MYSKPIGISVLTNGQRLDSLQRCLGSLLSFCYYRPLVIGIFDNGSKDDTWKWLSEWVKAKDNPWKYGVTFRIQHSDKDLGCAAGTNAACEMVRDCEFAVHLESDFEHLTPEESGEDRLWLRRAVEFMQAENGNFLYLRRMVGEKDMLLHWWSQWMPKIGEERGPYLSCPTFWWSNNPALRRNKALYDNGTLPLDTAKDGPKGSPGWSKPELTAKAPGRAWIHRWGVFVHERKLQEHLFGMRSCVSRMNGERCKYGFFKNGVDQDPFCCLCHGNETYRDMGLHEQRYKAALGMG